MSPRRVVAYALAVLGVAGATGLAVAFELAGLKSHEFSLFLSAIAVAVWYGGKGPGVAVLRESVGRHRPAP
jgi:hypothetical protein